MKKRWIVILVLLALLAVTGGYMVIEHQDMLPEALRRAARAFSNLAVAEESAAGEAEVIRVRRTPVAAAPKLTPAPTAEPTPEPTAAPDPSLAVGSRGDEVKAMQKRLRELGFTTSSADGIFGERTQAAVMAFQEYLYDLERPETEPLPTPSPDPNDTVLLDAQDGGEEPTASPAPTAPAENVTFDGVADEALLERLYAFSGHREDLASGSRGAEVERLQTRLNTLDYLYGGVDGIYGANTSKAITAFQKRNKLEQTGEANRATQLVLFSEDAVKAERPAMPYVLKIDVSKQKVYAYGWSTVDGAYTKLVRTMTCSTGLKDTPTPTGTFKASGAVARWGYFPKWDVWAQYLYRIKGSILFHSVLYTDSNESSVISGSVSKLGKRASHGCVRLSVEDAKWIYNNCPTDTSVTVY